MLFYVLTKLLGRFSQYKVRERIDGDKNNCGGLLEEEKLTVKGKGGIRTHARAFARLSP